MAVDEGMWQLLQEHLDYTDEEMKLFRENPRNEDVLSKAGELMGDNDAQAFAEAALRFSSANPTVSAGYSLATAARHVAQLREAEQNLRTLIDAQRKKIVADGSSPTARTTLSTWLTMLANVLLSQERFDEAAEAARFLVELLLRMIPFKLISSCKNVSFVLI